MGKNIIEQYGIFMIVNYLRKSRQDLDRERKTGEDTLHEQKQLMDRVLANYGVPYDQKLEIGSGDKIETRPVFQEVIKELEKGTYNAIAVKEISRMGRGSYKDMGLIYDLIQDKRIFIITPHRIYDPSNPSDLRMIRFELFMSREEFETTRERLSGGRYNAAMEGKWVAGAAPYGFTYNKQTKKLDINEEEAEVVRTVFDFYANGIIVNGKRKLVQFRALSTYLHRLGIKTPKGKDTWHPTQLRNFLTNDRYIGNLRFRTHTVSADGKRRIPRPESEHIIVEDAHPAIIDPETWEKVMNRVENRDVVPRSKLDFDPCELAGLCLCVKCGRRMIRQYSVEHYKKKDGTTTVYHKEFLWCTTAGCTFVKYRNVEEDLLETLRQIESLDDEKLISLYTAVQQNEPEEDEGFESILKQIEIKKESLNRRLKFVYEKYETGIYSDDEFIKRRADIEKELKEIESISSEQGREAAEEPEIIFNPEDVRKRASSLIDMYKAATHKSQRNEILRRVFENVEIEIIEKGRGRKQAVHKIRPHFRENFFTKNVLV